MKVPRHYRGLLLPGRRARTGLAVAASVVTLLGLVGPATAAPPAAADPTPEPVRLTAADLAQVAAGSSVSVPLTLLTGDVVEVSLDAGGNPAVRQVTPAPRADGTPVAFHTFGGAGGSYLVPSDALPLIADDLLDLELFHLGKLAAMAAANGAGQVPVLVSHSGRVSAARAAATPGIRAERNLPSIDATAMTVDGGGGWWRAITQATATPGRAAALTTSGPLAGVEKVWLDSLAEVTLDQSVPQVGTDVAWGQGYDGTGVTVAVLDTGVDASHPDLAGKVVEAVDFTGSENGPVDGHGHGTHVAATIAGTGAGSGGLRPGVAKGAELLVGKVCNDGGGCENSDVIAGMEWAAQSGAPVVSMSLGGAPTDGTDPMSQAVNQLSREHGTLFVIAAGNAGPSGQAIGTPGSADDALTVAAVDKQDRMASFSSRGPRKGDLAPKPDIAAPGVDIVAARAAGTTMGTPVDDLYTSASGTSMATPHVSGGAAILVQQRPDLIGSQLKGLLMSTAADLGHRVVEQGAGRLDLAQAVDPSVFVTGNVIFGRLSYPHAPLTRTLTYHNVTDAPLTLTLDPTVTGPGDQPPAAGLLTLAATELTVPAGGTAQVTATADGSRLGPDGAFGGYRGSVRAVDPDGKVRASTPLSAFFEPRRFPVTVDVTLPAGATDMSIVRPTVIPVDDQVDLHAAGPILVRGGTVDLFPGAYSFNAHVTWRDPAGQLHQAAPVAPEVVVTDQPASISLDLREARPIRVQTPEPTETYSATSVHTRTSATGDWTSTVQLFAQYQGDEPRWWALPTEPVTIGELGFSSHHVLVPPTVTMRAVGQGASLLHPRYPTVDATVDGPNYSWTEGDETVSRQTHAPVLRFTSRLPVRLVDGGAGRPEDLTGLDLAGRLVLLTPTDICPDGQPCTFPLLRERVAALAAAGAVGALVAGESGWVDLGRAPFTSITCPGDLDSCPPVEPYLPIPTMRVSATEAADLAGRLERGRVRVLTSGTDELPRVYTLAYPSPGRVPEALPKRVDLRDLDRVEHRFHADRPGEVTNFSWLRALPEHQNLERRMALPQVSTQRTLTMLVGPGNPDAVQLHEVATVAFQRPGVPDRASAVEETHEYIPDGGSVDVAWNLGPVVPGTGVAPTTRSGFTPNITHPCAGCREGDVLYPTLFLTTADGHRSEFVGVVNDTGLTKRLIGIVPCEPPECQIRLYDAAGNEIEQRLIRIEFGIGGGQPTTEETDR